MFCLRAAILIKIVNFFYKTSKNNNNDNNKDFLCPSVNFSGRKSSLDTYMLLAFGNTPEEVSVSEPFRSSNLQQWQIKDHEGNRLQVPVRASFVLSQHSGKRHLLVSVNLMARQRRRQKKIAINSSLSQETHTQAQGGCTKAWWLPLEGRAAWEPVPALGWLGRCGIILQEKCLALSGNKA